MWYFLLKHFTKLSRTLLKREHWEATSIKGNDKFREELIAYCPLIWHGPLRRRRVHQFFSCCACIRCRSNVFTEQLPSNDWGIHSIIFQHPVAFEITHCFPFHPLQCSYIYVALMTLSHLVHQVIYVLQISLKICTFTKCDNFAGTVCQLTIMLICN
jgi:hypothetical protein